MMSSVHAGMHGLEFAPTLDKPGLSRLRLLCYVIKFCFCFCFFQCIADNVGVHIIFVFAKIVGRCLLGY